MEHPDPRCRPAGEGHQRDEQQEEGHQDVDGRGGALHSGLAAAPAVRRPEPDGSSDQHVGMTNHWADSNPGTAGTPTSTSSGSAATGWPCPTAHTTPSSTCSAM